MYNSGTTKGYKASYVAYKPSYRVLQCPMHELQPVSCLPTSHYNQSTISKMRSTTGYNHWYKAYKLSNESTTNPHILPYNQLQIRYKSTYNYLPSITGLVTNLYCSSQGPANATKKFPLSGQVVLQSWQLHVLWQCRCALCRSACALRRSNCAP